MSCIVANLLLRHVVVPFNHFFASLENDCDVFEKTLELLVDSCFIYNKYCTSRLELRSRYAKFISIDDGTHIKLRALQRDREPSRIPVKQITRIMNKSRQMRKRMRKYIVKNIPMSFKIHCYVNKCNFL